jgi:hypothetical protein
VISYLTFNTGIEILCFLTALICLSGNTNLYWKLSIPYLFITCATECGGIYLRQLQQPNQWPYNVLLIFQILFISLMFKHLFSAYLKDSILFLSGIAALLVLYLFEMFMQSFWFFNTITYNAMCILYVFYCLYFFYKLLNDENYIELKYSAMFWWVTGALFFYFGSTAVNLFRGKLSDIAVDNHSLTYYIYTLLNLILYGCWCLSFICKKWLKTA